MKSPRITQNIFSITILIFALFYSGLTYCQIDANAFLNSKLRGFGIGEIKYGVRSATDIDALAKTGANIARVFLVLNRCPNCENYSVSNVELTNLDELFWRLTSRSINVVLVLEPMNDGRGAFWNSTPLQNSYIENWKVIASRYKNQVNTVGFDLMNEPVPPGKTYNERQNTWLNFAERLARAIREVDFQRTLIVESAPDATTSSFGNMKPLPLDNIVYSFHSYSPISLSHQGVMKEYPMPLSYGPEMEITKDDVYKILDIVDQFAKKYGVPIFVGEFSIARWAPGGSSIRYLKDSIDYFESKGWSWSYHDFRGWHGWDAEIDSEDRSITSRTADAKVYQMLSSKMRANKK